MPPLPDDSMLPDWAVANADASLKIGLSVPDIEQRLVAQGLSPTTAAAVVTKHPGEPGASALGSSRTSRATAECASTRVGGVRLRMPRAGVLVRRWVVSSTDAFVDYSPAGVYLVPRSDGLVRTPGDPSLGRMAVAVPDWGLSGPPIAALAPKGPKREILDCFCPRCKWDIHAEQER
jgi:hypothetical protein